MTEADLLILVPAWNEEEVLGSVLSELAASEVNHRVLVIDDGSTDRTADIAEAAGVAVLRLPINLGVGGAMRAGYRWALRQGFSYAVQVDADGQHDPRDLDRLLAPVLAGELDLCIGARFAGLGEYDLSRTRRFAMRFLAWLISSIVGTKLTDTTSGFKVANARTMKVFAEDFPMEYLGDTVEALIIGHKAGLRIGQVPVAMRGRQGGSPSHESWRMAVLTIRALLAVSVAMTRRATKAPES